jgi:hypothetical protein
MFRGLGSRFVLMSIPALIAAGTFALASPAGAVAVGPGQYFTGEVFGPTSASSQTTEIDVDCTSTGAAATGHPVPGQTVEVNLLVPPVTTTAGYTGSEAVEIDSSLIYTQGTLSVDLPIATFTQYSVKEPIPTSITVPCTGAGVVSFSPYPLDSGTPSNVNITFVSTGT